MKVSYNWLNNRFFDKKLPTVEKLAELLTMYSFEVESIERIESSALSGANNVSDDTVLDIKVLPNRSHDCLSHKGIAHELSVLIPKRISYKREKVENFSTPDKLTANHISLSIEKDALCNRATKRMVFDVRVEDSPDWLKNYLIALGQKPINNVVDCANFVMLETGQPVHTFDFDKISGNDKNGDSSTNSSSADKKNIIIRNAKEGEIIKCLDGKDYVLNSETMVIADPKKALDIAGIKGGMASGIDKDTKRVLVSACNFDAVSIRKTSKKLGLRTDASVRFENEITPELVGEAMELLSALLEKIAGGRVAPDTLDIYGNNFGRENQYIVGVSIEEINKLLGSHMSVKHVSDILTKAGLKYKIVDPIKEIIKLSTTLTGVPYKWGASRRFDAPRFFDCSSFTSYLYMHAGVAIPRVTIDQYVFGEPVDMAHLMPGDLLFFSSKAPNTHYKTIEFMPGFDVSEGVDHVAMYLGKDFIVHSSGKAKAVVVEHFENNSLQKTCIGARRIVSSKEKRFVVEIPFERLDIRIKEDLIEEIQRLSGLEKIKPIPLSFGEDKTNPKQSWNIAIDKTLFYQEKIRIFLTGLDFSEVYTYSFTEKGEVEVLNPIASNKSFLRAMLNPAINDSLLHNDKYKDLLGLKEIKIFEIGNVFNSLKETMSLAIGIKSNVLSKEKTQEELKKVLGQLKTIFNREVTGTIFSNVLEIDLGKEIESSPEPIQYEKVENDSKKVQYKKISQYPFVVRDIAVFVPKKISDEKVLKKILDKSGPLLVTHKLFDVFTKKLPDGSEKTSYAFRLVFQSEERTLTDDEVNKTMESVALALNSEKDWQVR